MSYIELFLLLIVVCVIVILPLVSSSKEMKSLDNTSEEYKRKSAKDGMASAGYFCSLLSIFLWLLPPVGFVASILGFILSILSLSSNKRKLAMWGLIISIVGIILSVTNWLYGFSIGYLIGSNY